MAAIVLSAECYQRSVANRPTAQLVNRYVEPLPQSLGGGAQFLPRPGLVEADTVGDGPIRGMFKQSGVLNGDTLIVSASTLSRRTPGGTVTSIGSIAGADLVEFASDGTNTYIAAGTLYLYDGTTLSTVATPNAEQIVSVVHINGYIVLQVEGSGVFYWIQPGAIIIDALDFATAERAPDAGVAIRVVGDFLVLLNAQTGEFWTTTGDPDAAFQRQSGIVLDKGCAARETAINLDNGLFWASETADEGRAVYRTGQGSPERVSVHGIEERMRSATAMSAFGFTFDGHAFYALRLEGVGTFLYDASTRVWSEWSSYGLTCWRPQVAASAPGGPLLLGSAEDGKLYTLDPEIGNDEGGVIQRLITGFIGARSREVVDTVRLYASVGWSPSLTLTPVVEMRVAKDLFTFGNWRERTFGARGAFSHRVVWERLGEIKPPGLVIEWRDSDSAQITISGATYNEPL